MTKLFSNHCCLQSLVQLSFESSCIYMLSVFFVVLSGRLACAPTSLFKNTTLLERRLWQDRQDLLGVLPGVAGVPLVVAGRLPGFATVLPRFASSLPEFVGALLEFACVQPEPGGAGLRSAFARVPRWSGV